MKSSFRNQNQHEAVYWGLISDWAAYPPDVALEVSFLRVNAEGIAAVSFLVAGGLARLGRERCAIRGSPISSHCFQARTATRCRAPQAIRFPARTMILAVGGCGWSIHTEVNTCRKFGKTRNPQLLLDSGKFEEVEDAGMTRSDNGGRRVYPGVKDGGRKVNAFRRRAPGEAKALQPWSFLLPRSVLPRRFFSSGLLFRPPPSRSFPPAPLPGSIPALHLADVNVK